MTKIIGLTGGIGSGKTIVARHIESLGIPVYIADDEAKKVLELTEIKVKLEQIFGKEVFESGKLNTKKLAEIVFNNSIILEQLNQIIHPLVKQDFQNWLKQHSEFSFVVKEAAILFESGSYKDCDAIISITAPLDIRIQRVIARDKSNLESVMNRIKNQWTDEMRVAKSDYVVENVDIEKTMLKVEEILKKLSIHQK